MVTVPPIPRLKGDTLEFMQRLWNVAHALEVASKRMARTLGVTGPQRLVLRIIGLHPTITAQAIASTLGMHPSTLTGVLARLERRKLIARVWDPSDRRRARFRLTPAGKRVDGERKGTVEAAVRRALVRADGDVRATLATLDVLAQELVREE
ncbi:MAG TPA: MarR family transcriptional regulator [Kofleriaceae bacterium]|jgi:DNA-binding MarR family transcriptional regulator|nr:MarR family transcriptional regulator [Kofleriaceae bacterium]